MEATVTVTLSQEIRSELEAAIREEGLATAELISKAITDYLFIRKFRSLRQRLLAQSPVAYTDEEIFALVS